jgi:hypothetical protein
MNWVRVGDWLVSPIYVAPVGIGEAVELAEKNGCVLPSPELVDAIWQLADLKVEPLPRKTDGTPATMSTAAVYQDQAARIAEQYAGRDFRLIAGTHKDVVMKGGRVGLYGWHRLDGTVIQPFFGGHSASWKDYSQGLRLVKRA